MRRTARQNIAVVTLANLSEYIQTLYDLAAFDYEGFKKKDKFFHTMDKLIDENKSKHAVSIQRKFSKYRM